MPIRKCITDKFWHILTFCTFTTASVMLIIFIYWTIEPFGKNIIEVPGGIKVIDRTIIAGKQDLVVQYRYCKNYEVQDGVVKRFIKNGSIHFLPSVLSNVSIGCKDLTLPIELPENLPPATYTYNAEITYQVNPIKKVTYYFQSESFDIVAE